MPLPTGKLAIRPLHTDEYDEWLPLWQAYLAFYKASVPERVTQITWKRLHDSHEPMGVFGAFVGSTLVGFVHYLAHRTTWAETNNVYLQDLFVAPDNRQAGIGRALIERVYVRAKELGAGQVYWVTQSGNTRARALYDQLAENTHFIKYRKVF